MLLQDHSQQDTFLTEVTSHFDDQLFRYSHRLQKYKKTFFSKFIKQGLPSKKDSLYRFFPLSNLSKTNFFKNYTPVTPDISETKKSCALVFDAEGILDPERSSLKTLHSMGVELLSIEDALKKYGLFLQRRLTEWSKQSLDPFLNLNLAMSKGGVFMYIPPHCKISQKIVIQLLTDSQIASFPFMFIMVGKEAKASFMLDYPDGYQGLNINFMHFDVEEQAIIDLFIPSYTQREQTYAFNFIRGRLKKGSLFTSKHLATKEQLLHMSYDFSLVEEGASVDLQGAWLLDEHQKVWNDISIRHVAPHTHSKQLFKGVLKGSAYSHFKGKIYVEASAQKTEAYQLNNNLILSDEAKAETLPSLEIFADDVKASHGATVGQIDEESLFYLRSRGLSKEDAKHALIHGFIGEIFVKLPESIRKTFYD